MDESAYIAEPVWALLNLNVELSNVSPSTQ